LKHLLRSVVALGILAVPAVAAAQVTGGVRVRFHLVDLVLPPMHPRGLAVFVTVPLNDVVAFQPEVLSNLQDAKSSAKTKFDHYQVPLLGRFRFAKGSPVAFLAGPSVGFWTRVDEVAGNSEIHVKGFEFGYAAGVEMEADHGVLAWRYTWGLSDIAKNGAPEAGDNGWAKRRVLSLSAGWRF
jgi:hypothetical protein